MLGVTRNASDEEIKKAYRALALKFHPDKAKDKKSHEQFTAINEAYQVLGNKDKKQKYDYLYEYIIVRGQYPPSHLRGRTAQPYYKRYFTIRQHRERWSNPSYAAPTASQLIYPKKLLKVFKVFCTICLAFALLIFADYFIPYKTWLQDVKLYTLGHPSTGVTYVAETASVKFNVEDPVLTSDKAEVIGTRILNIVRYIRLTYDNSPILKQASYSIYNNFLFLPIGLFISSVTGLRFQKSESILVKAGIANVFILILVLVVL